MAQHDINKIDFVEIEERARQMRAEATRHAFKVMGAWVKSRIGARANGVPRNA